MAPMPWRSVCQARWFVISGGWARPGVAVRQRDRTIHGVVRGAMAWVTAVALPSGDAPPEFGGRHPAEPTLSTGDRGATVSLLQQLASSDCRSSEATLGIEPYLGKK